MKLRDRSRIVSDDVRARQRNTIWPDTLRNETTFLGFLWNGSPTATPVQRVGIALIALIFFLIPALLLLYVMAHTDSEMSRFVPVAFALLTLAIGCKLLRNAFRGLN